MDELIKTYQNALDADPNDISAIISLEEIFLQQKRWEELIALYRKEAESIKNPLYSSYLRWRIGEIFSEKLSDDESAIKELKKALELDSRNMEALKTLRGLCMKAGRWDESLALLRIEGDAAQTPEARARAFLLGGTILLEKMHSADKGIAELEKAVAHDAKDPEIAEALERAYTRESRWEGLAKFLEGRASHSKNPKEAVGLFYRAGRIWMDRVNNPQQALACHTQALALDPSHMETLRAMEEILLLESKWNDLSSTLEKEADLLKDAHEAHSLRLSAGEIWKVRLADPEKAIAGYLKILKADPHHIESLNAMEDILLQFGRWKEIVPVLERHLEREKDPRQSTALRLRIGMIWKNRLNNPDKAIHCFLKVLEIDPINRTALHGLNDTLTQNKRWEELVPVLEKLAETSQDPQEYMDLYMRTAEIWDQELKNSRKAIEAFQKVLAKEPTHLPTLKALETLCLREQDWKSLIRVLEREAEVFQNPRMAMAVYLWIGEICHTRLSDAEAAIASYTKALAFAPNDVPTLRALEALYSGKGAHDELVKVYKKILKATEDPNEQALFNFKLAELQEKSLKQVDDAVESYRKVLSLAPAHLGALSALERIYRGRGNWEECAKVLEARTQSQDDPRDVASLHAQLGDIYEHSLNSEDRAAGAYAKALSLDPDNSLAYEGLKRLYLHKEAWPDLVQILEKEEQRLTLPEERAALLLRIGRLSETRMNAPDRALTYYQHALEVFPGHYPSLQALEGLYTRDKKWEDLLGVYRKELGLITDQRRIITLYHKMAEIHTERLPARDEAAALYGKILDLDPSDVTALQALEAIYEQSENWQGILDVLKIRSKLVEKKEDVIPIYEKAAAVYRDKLNLPDRARDAFEKILELAPDNAAALDAIEEHHFREGHWRELIDILHRKAKVVRDPAPLSALYFRCGEIWEDQLGDIKEAILCHEKVLELMPGHFMAVRALERLYAQKERWEDLLTIMAREAELRSDDQQSVSIALRSAEIVETKLMQRDRAEGLYREVLKKNPDNGKALSSLSRILRVAAKWTELVDVLRKMADMAAGPGESLPLLLDMGNICKDKIPDRDRALTYFKEAHSIDPTSIDAFEGMRGIYRTEGQWEEMVKVLEEEIMLVRDPAKKIELLTEMGQTFHEKLGRKKEAAHCFEQALSIKPDHLPALRPLADFYRSEARWDRASQVMDALISMEKDPKKRVEYLTVLGKVFQDGLRDPEKASRCYEEALGIDPSDIPSLEALGSIYEAKGDWPNLTKTYQRAVDTYEKADPRKALPFHVKLGDLYANRLGNDDRALGEYQRAVRADPQNLAARVGLTVIYGKNPQTKSEFMREHMKILQIDPARTESARIAGRIYEEQGQLDKAYCLYSLIDLFGAADKMERLFIDSNRPKVPKKGKRPLDEEMREKLLIHPLERNAARRFLRTLDDQVGGLYPPHLERFGGLKKLEGLFQSHLPPAQVFQEVVETLGVGPVTLMVAEGAFSGLAADNTVPPTLVLSPKAFEGLTQEEARFVIGRHADVIGSRHILSRKIPPGELWEFLLLIVRGLDLAIEISGKGEDYIQKKLKEVKKVISRKNRKPLEEAAAEFMKTYRKIDIQSHLKGQALTGIRAGFVSCNELGTALSALMKTEKQFAGLTVKDPDNVKKLLSASAEARELLQFSLSDDYFVLRNRLGLSLLSV